MTSSEKILAGIIEEAEASAAQIIAEAKEQAEKIISEESAKAAEKAEKIISDAEKKAETVKASGNSAAALLKRDIALKCRRRLIDNAFAGIVRSINSFDDGRYFDFIIKLAEKNRLSQNGILFLNGDDLAKRNIAELSSRLFNLDISVSEMPEKLNGGFILKYGDILINCGIEALINEKREELTDCLNNELFK